MKLRQLESNLIEALRLAHMGNAGFGEHDELIKERTRLWRHSWLIPAIRDSLEMVQEEINKQYKKK
jgi:hypothetical protein